MPLKQRHQITKNYFQSSSTCRWSVATNAW